MSKSSDPGHFFQTTSTLENSARKAAKAKNTKGNPVILPSKILAVVPNPENPNQVYVAEAAGKVKTIDLEEAKTNKTYFGSEAPLTSLAISPSTQTVFAGCWDKTIWSWDLQTRKPGLRFTHEHRDFIKTVITFNLQGKELLVSGSADATIIVWEASTGKKLHVLKGHTRGILFLALDPEEYDANKETTIVLSAGTDREIRRWSIGLNSASEIFLDSENQGPILAHETSIDSIRFDADGDLWTASADKTVKCLSRARNWEVDTTLEHPDFVRDVVVDDEGGWVVTACRDEEVRVWEKGSGKLYHTFSGHYEEVTALALLPGQKVVSVSIDGTVRQWSLKAQDLKKAILEAEEERLGKKEEKEEEKKGGGMSVLTEEEERELAELMEESD